MRNVLIVICILSIIFGTFVVFNNNTEDSSLLYVGGNFVNKVGSITPLSTYFHKSLSYLSSPPVLSPDIDGKKTAWGSAWKDEDVYHMYYSYDKPSGDGLQIGHAISFDGNNFTKDANNPVLATGPSWDELMVWDPVVWEENDTWYMLYTGSNNSSVYAIGLASSFSPYGPWTKEKTNPVLEGSLGEWDSNDAENMNLIKVNDTYYLYYNSLKNYPRRVGLATSKNLTTWSKDSNNPIFEDSNAKLGYFQAAPFKYNSNYYLLVMHYRYGTDYADMELYRDTNPTFYYDEREFVKNMKSCSLGFDYHDQDTPCVITNDIYRNSFPNDEFWLYYAGESFNVWSTGLIIEDDLNSTLGLQ
jgi:predicted GH43/DUF377 family glycosyl hydrolase